MASHLARAQVRQLTTEESLIDAAVRDVMVENPVTVTPDIELKDLVDLFVREGLQGVPVVAASDQRLLGIITESDLILQEVEGDVEVPHFVPFLDGVIFFDRTDKYDRQMRKAFAATAGDLMNDEVKTVGPDETIHEAAKKMSKHNISRLVVVEGDQVVGMIARSHIVLALARYEFNDAGDATG
jgi:CBS domain-containing protein